MMKKLKKRQNCLRENSKKLSRMTVAKLQQKENLRASSNIALIPQNWSLRREYSQDKRGRERLAWELPDFIKRIGVVKVRQLLRERENRKTKKVMIRKWGRLKLRSRISKTSKVRF
ncbi:hypothetical protein TNIN_140021 [Trichonephila inaurata madagascariensis]|uniref:DUF382 domain-containing protein n=1 Tax=Trichonephila inaurata madagascariensis TaxID=2747483 RepID=A0A8X6IJ55_9ARAC|nr:hypothetical protein TNIN_140021 [Trichonephila inaurata madagascariensis]